jgi:peptidoglycan/xylan/chitin deacetylase (PgdA/CDA1 family)
MRSKKNILKHLINALVYFSGAAYISHVRHKGAFRILLYHRVHPHSPATFKNNLRVTPAAFERQIRFMKRQGYTFLSLQEVCEHVTTKKPAPEKAVVITFDDGYRDNYTYAWPILKKYRVPAIIFLTTTFVDHGRPLWIDTIDAAINRTTVEKVVYNDQEYYLSTPHKRRQFFRRTVDDAKLQPASYIDRHVENVCTLLQCNPDELHSSRSHLSWDEIREMTADTVTVGSHGLTHISLAHQPREVVEREVKESKRIIETHNDRAVSYFAYPYGQDYNSNEEVISSLRQNGYTAACAVNERFCRECVDLFRLNRISVEGFDTLLDFRCKLSGFSVLRLHR